jgi:ketosteroid isomerase-like protein
VRLAIEATNRGDYEAALVIWADDAETINARGVLTVGGAPQETRSRSERIRYRQQWSAEWDGFGFERVELIDLGQRIVVLVHATGSGPTSGVRFDQDGGFVLDLSGGRVVREQIFLDRAEALEAAGLSE